MRQLYLFALVFWNVSLNFSSQLVVAQNETDTNVSLPFCSDLVDSKDSFDVSYGYGEKTCKWAESTCTEEVCMIDEVQQNCPRICEVECLTDSGAVGRAKVVPSTETSGQIKRRKTQIVLWSLAITAFVATVAILLKRKQIKTVAVMGSQDENMTKKVLTSKEILNIWNSKREKSKQMDEDDIKSVCDSVSSQNGYFNGTDDMVLDIEQASTGQGELEIVLVPTPRNVYSKHKSASFEGSGGDDEESINDEKSNSSVLS
jgi:hypothetical protein